MVLGKYQVAICESKTHYSCVQCDFKHMNIFGIMSLDYCSDEGQAACCKLQDERMSGKPVFFKIVGDAV